MRRISGYIISLLIIFSYSNAELFAQDTILIPLKIKVGLEVSGPVIYFSDKNILSYEGYFAYDINEKLSAVLGAGYLDFKHSQYNYNYLNKGMFARLGVDLNLLKPDKSQGKYWVGLGLRYGISIFNSEFPEFNYDNYWGSVSSSVAPKKSWGHFIEISPGVRAEVFRNISMGWTASLRMLLYTGAGKDTRPIYFPGYGNAVKSFNPGLSYFIVWNIPYKKIKVIMKQEEPDDTEDTEETQDNVQNKSGSTGTVRSSQQNNTFR